MKPRRITLAVTAALLLASCALLPSSGDDAETTANLQPQRLDQMDLPQPPARLALALGGGGLRGYAHLGVLQALHEADIQPDLVVGSSAGALVGAAYASGRSPEQLLAAVRALRVASLIDLNPGGGGLMHTTLAPPQKPTCFCAISRTDGQFWNQGFHYHP